MDLRLVLGMALTERYDVGDELGRGGMAVVLTATDRRTGGRVALKALHPDLARAVAARRFLREIEMLRRVSHPGIVPCLDAGSATVATGLEIPWFTMPLLGTGTLRTRLAGNQRLPLAEALALTGGICAPLAHAHEQGVLHRDLTPGNILLHEGQPVITDFGVARAACEAGGEQLSSAGIVVGSPAYMSPEQALGERSLTPAADLYSLGAILHEMLAGEPLFGGRTPRGVAARHLKEKPIDIRILRPEVPARVAALLEALLAKDPEARPASAREVARVVEAEA